MSEQKFIVRGFTHITADDLEESERKENNCKWLSDQFSYICCNAGCREHVADSCPYSEESPLNGGDLRDEAVFCAYYEPKQEEKEK